MTDVDPGEPFLAVGHAPTGLTGTVGVQVIDNAGGVTMARTTSGIVEVSVLGVPSGIYMVMLTAPLALGQYSVIGDGGVGGPTHVWMDDLFVTLITANRVVIEFAPSAELADVVLTPSGTVVTLTPTPP